MPSESESGPVLGNADIGVTGAVAIFIGFFAHAVTTVYCLKASCEHHHRSARTFHYISLVVTGTAALAYLLMGLGALAHEDTYWLHFAEWVCTTPLLLVDLGLLARMAKPEIYFIAVADVLMIGAGYYAETQSDGWRIWPVMCFSVVMFLVILQSLISHLSDIKAHPNTNQAESKAFVFLATYTIFLWTGYSVLWTVIKVGLIPVDTAAILYTLMDIAAKDVFGLIIFGVRDVLSGDATPLSSFAQYMTGVTTAMRRNSIEDGVAQVMAVLTALETGASSDPVAIKKLVAAAKNGDLGGGSIAYSGAGSVDESGAETDTGGSADGGRGRQLHAATTTGGKHNNHAPGSARNLSSAQSGKVSFREGVGHPPHPHHGHGNHHHGHPAHHGVPPLTLPPHGGPLAAGRRISTSALLAAQAVAAQNGGAARGGSAHNINHGGDYASSDGEHHADEGGRYYSDDAPHASQRNVQAEPQYM